MIRILAILLFISNKAFAGDAHLFWRFGELSNRLIIYTDDDFIVTNIPTSIFLVGLLTLSFGLISLILSAKLYPVCLKLIGGSLIFGTIGAYLLSSFFSYIGANYFDSYSVKLFWSWACTGGMIGATLFTIAPSVFACRIKPTKMQNKAQ